MVAQEATGMLRFRPGFISGILLAMLPTLLVACLPDAVSAVFEPGDLRPPAVAGWGPSGPSELLIDFDEAVQADPLTFTVSAGPEEAPINIVAVRSGPSPATVLVELDRAQDPGRRYAVTGIVSDPAGNQSSFVLPYWGHNPDPARLLINELLTEGTSTRPDAIELYVATDGNLAGIALFIGSPRLHDFRYIFPACAVMAGDYIVLHLKPQSIPEEVDELLDRTVSGGVDATADAWDFWCRIEPGSLSGKNGVVTVCQSPTGTIMDAVPYSERTSESDSRYDGFGTAAFRDRVAEIVAADAWRIAGSSPRPEDCASSTGTTSTRTICRSSTSADSDSAADWYVVPTRGISLGRANTDERYVK
jgi:hypothetical protein